MWGECLLGAHKAEDIHIMYSMWRSCSSRTQPTRRGTIRFKECQQETTLMIGNGEAMTTTELLIKSLKVPISIMRPDILRED